MDTIAYWHIELDSPDVLLAQNMPAESYLDMGNRGFFREADVVDLTVGPDGRSDATLRTQADFCRPFHGNGPIVAAARLRLAARAASIGWTRDATDPFGGLHIVVSTGPILTGCGGGQRSS